MKKNGQALVEFIIILPILIILLLGIVDISLIFYRKNWLENNLNEVIKVWEDKRSVESIDLYLDDVNKKIEFDVVESEETTTIKLFTEYDPVTPGLNRIFSDNYQIEAERVIYNG